MFALNARMKDYEERFRRYLQRRVPVIVRVDGRAFQTFAREMDFDRPFSLALSEAMEIAAKALARDINNFKVGYIQSDKASFLLTDYDNLNTGAWFDYCQNKIESISASVMTAAFNEAIGATANFDARSFNIPKEDVVNYFLCLAQDWSDNSLQMYARSFYSSKQLMNKTTADKHIMLKSIGKDWRTDVPERFKYGVWLTKDGTTFIEPEYEAIKELLHEYLFLVEPPQ